MLQTTVEKLLNEYNCKVDDDAKMLLVNEWNRRYGTARMDLLRERIEILADWDIGDTESGRMDLKTMEEFIEDDFGMLTFE